jgi:hypothetical protein
MTIPLTAQNDNKAPPPSEKLIGSTLTNVAVIDEHLRTGLQAMLKANGVPDVVRDAVAEFVQPAIAILERMEKEVIDYARTSPNTSTLELFSSEFERQARTPDQVRLAAHFREYVSKPEPEPVVSTVVFQLAREPPHPANDPSWLRLVKGPRVKPKEKDGPEMEP